MKPDLTGPTRAEPERTAELRKANLEAQASETRMRAIADSAQDAILMMDPEGRVSYWNPAAEHILGYTSAEAIGQQVHELIAPARFHPAYQAAAPAFRLTGQGAAVGKTLDLEARRKDGQEISVQLSLSAIQINGGWHGVGILRDITERKRAEGALRNSEIKYRTVFESSVDGILIADIETKVFTYANPAVCRMLGYAAEELRTLGVLDIHPKDALPHVVAEFEAQVRGEKTLATDLPCLRKDGTLIYANINTTTVIIDGRQCLVGFFRDITERKRAEEALRQSEGRFRILFEQAADVLFLLEITPESIPVIRDANSATFRLLGYERNELIGQPVSFIEAGPDTSKVVEKRRQNILSGMGQIFETRHRCKDGTIRDFECSVTEMQIGSKTFAISVERDITERKRVEEALRASQQIIEGILDAMPVRVFWKDKNLVYLGCNAVLAHEAGFADPKDLIGKDDYQMGWGDRAELYRRDDRQVIESGCPKLLIEEPLTTAEGNTITLLTSKIPLRGPNGEVSGILGMYMDITERKRAEAALRSSEERFRIVAETANDVIYEWDLKQSVEWLGKIDEMLGYEPGEFPRTMNGFAASVHPEDLERTMAAIQAQLEGRVPFAIEYRVRRKDGVYRWWSARGAVARTPDGKPTRWIGSITDFTERRQAEERLTQEHDLSEGILNNIPGLFYLITEKGRFLRWNRQLETVSGYSGEEIAQMHPLDIFPAEHKGLVAEQILQVFKTGRGSVEANLLTKQGEQLPFYFIGGIVIVDGQPCLAGTGIDITERKRAEEALRNSEIKYRTLFESSIDGILIADLETKVLKYANPAVCRMLGYAAEELRTMGVSAIHPKDAWPHVAAEFEAQAQGKKTLATELPCLRKDGTLIYVDVNATTVTIDGRQCLIGFFRDITERKRVEETLRRSETKFRTLYDSTSDAVMLLDPKGFFDCNPATLAMFGCATREEFCSKHPADVSPPVQPDGTDSLTLASQRIATAMAKGSDHFEWMQQRADTGATFPADVLLSAMELDGKPVLQAVVRDITERKRAEEKIQQLSRAVEQSPASIVITDPAGNMKYVNPKFVELTGYAVAEVLGKNPRVLKSGETIPEAYRQLWQTITAGKEWRGEFHNKKKNGELYWESASISPIRDLAGRITHYLAVKEDITARKQAEAERSRLIQELQAALANVKSLSGLLPICAGCKKIRDDKGYWSQVESYVQAHSEAKFTHGLCPDCIKKYYPELEEASLHTQ